MPVHDPAKPRDGASRRDRQTTAATLSTVHDGLVHPGLAGFCGRARHLLADDRQARSLVRGASRIFRCADLKPA